MLSFPYRQKVAAKTNKLLWENVHFLLRIKTMDRDGPGGLLGAHYRPGGTPKQPLLKSMSPQMSKKVEKCEFCLVDYSL